MPDTARSPPPPLPPPPLLPPPPPATTRAPEFYGFVASTATYLLFALYLLWALLPDALIRALGVAWYPNRQWAVLLPAYSVVAVLLTYAAYLALALAGTPALADLRTLTDARALAPPLRAGAHAELHDLPLGLVGRVVYRPRARAPRR